MLSHSVMSDSLQSHGLSMAFSRQEYWSGLSCPSPGGLPNRGIESRSPTLQVDSLPSEPLGKPLVKIFFFHFSFLHLVISFLGIYLKETNRSLVK